MDRGYDLLGRMTSITRQSGTSEKLYYDAFGALVQRQAGSMVSSYVGKRATVTGTLAAGCKAPSCGVVVSAVDVHVTLGSRRIASVRVYPAGAPRTLYYYRDRLGSVLATTLDGGRAGASYRYSAYGALEIAVGESSDSASENSVRAGDRHDNRSAFWRAAGRTERPTSARRKQL